MNRRGFLRSAASAAVGVALAPIAAKLLPEWAPLIPPPAKPVTNFAALTPKQTVVWSRALWEQQRDRLFIQGMLKPRFIGSENGDFGVITID